MHEDATTRPQDALLAPFRGLRYTGSLDTRTAPPYDVIDPPEAERLRSLDTANVVHVDLPVDVGAAGLGSTQAGTEVDGTRAAHRQAAGRLEGWVDDGTLASDPEPVFYLYRQSWKGDDGAPTSTTGVVGALRIGDPAVRPHEQTTPKAKSDRLVSLEETGANLSMIYGLSLAESLGALLEPVGEAVAAVTDEDGVQHELWRVDDEDLTRRLAAAVDSAPVVIADGHHRYEVARRHIEALGDDAPEPARRIMAFVVPLDPAFLTVRPIHRILPGLGATPERLRTSLGELAAVEAAPIPEAGTIPERIGFVTGDEVLWCTPSSSAGNVEALAALDADVRDLAVSWLHTVALPALGADDVVFHHDSGVVAARVRDEPGTAGVLLPPVSVDDIARVAEAGGRMPPKTTFFWPKARTGLVLRRFADQSDQTLGRRKASPFDMPLAEAMRTQRAIRRLLPDPVDDALILECIELALKAPTGSNAQNWEFVVVRDRATMAAIGDLYRPAWRLYSRIGRAQNKSKPSMLRLLDAVQWQVEHFADVPVLVVPCLRSGPPIPPLGPRIALTSYYGSAYPSVQNLLLACRAAGLGACLTTMPLWNVRRIKKLLGLPRSVDPVCLVPIGWPRGRYGPTTRRPVEQVVHVDRYGNKAFDAH